MTRNPQVTRHVLGICAIADGKPPSSSALKDRYRQARFVAAEYRKIGELPVYRRIFQFRGILRITRLVREFYQQYPDNQPQ